MSNTTRSAESKTSFKSRKISGVELPVALFDQFPKSENLVDAISTSTKFGLLFTNVTLAN